MQISSRRFGMILGIVALVLGSGFGFAMAQNYWNPQGRSKPEVAANSATPKVFFPVKRCINVGGSLEPEVEAGWFSYKIRRGDFDIIAQAGFDTVRIPITWSAHAGKQAPYTIDPAFFARIDEVVGWALQARLHVIIDEHHYDELFKDPDAHEARLEGLWAQIADRYRNMPPSLMFEIINEPRDAFSGPRVNAVQARIVSLIRKTNPTRTVILTGDEWGGIDGMDNLVMPNDPYLVGSVHYYSPFDFTYQGAEFLDNPPPLGRKWPRAGELAALQQDMAKIKAFGARIRAPVFVGEYGTVDNFDINQRAAWTQAVTRALNDNAIPNCYFNFSAGMNAYDLKTESWKMPLLRALELTPKF